MRIIVVGDIHMTPDHITAIPNSATADLIILNGDLTNYGSAGDAKQVLETIMEVNPSVLALMGNLDKPAVNDYLEGLNLNLHNQARMFRRRVCLVGVGGSNQTPFHTPSEFSESQLALFVKNGMRQAQELIHLAEPIEKIKIPLILVSHTPPSGTTIDRLKNGRHVGSAAIRQAIETYQPDICVCGHIHESPGMDELGRTKLYNPGMFRRGGWLEIIINKSHITTTLHDRTN